MGILPDLFLCQSYVAPSCFLRYSGDNILQETVLCRIMCVYSHGMYDGNEMKNAASCRIMYVYSHDAYGGNILQNAAPCRLMCVYSHGMYDGNEMEKGCAPLLHYMFCSLGCSLFQCLSVGVLSLHLPGVAALFYYYQFAVFVVFGLASVYGVCVVRCSRVKFLRFGFG